MPRLLAVAALSLPLAGCAFVLDFDGFEVGDGVDGGDAGGLDGGTADGGDASLPDGFVPDGCEPTDEVCDGMDNDCDGATDEEGGALDDPEHCGACGISCATGYVCTDGICGDEARDLAAGANHTCARLANGEVWCFGENMDGEVGTGSFTDREPEPTTVAITGAANGVGAGAAHSCHVGDTTECWGRNDFGQLGDNTATRRASPVPTENEGDALEIVGGDAHTCVRTTTDVRCTGSNDSGQSGQLLSVTDQSRFESTTTPLMNALDITAGANHTCVVLSGGGVRCFGDNARGQLGAATPSESGAPLTPDLAADARMIAAGGEHTCAIGTDAAVYCWGSNSEGQLGTGVGGDTHEPARVRLDMNARAIAAGGTHTCAVVGSDIEVPGTVYCWGANDSGQLGNGTFDDSAEPVQVPEVRYALPVIAAGESHTCVVERIPSEGPRVRCWGLNTSGQLGIGGTSPPSSAEPLSADVPRE